MTTRRDAILSGVLRASELHAQLGIRDKLSDGGAPIDVLSAVHSLGLFALFRPLRGLLGAYVPTKALSGMLITTQRDLHVQRFTMAHELGHHVLQHKAISLDKDVGFVGRGENAGHSLIEVEADSFASEFLLPKWLIAAHLRRHKWGKLDIAQPDIVYQLSLRLGASFTATSWALFSHNFVDRSVVNRLVKSQPKASKQRAAPDLSPDNWHRDVWLISESDQGASLLGNPDDLLVLSLAEHVSGGYTWDEEGAKRAGLSVEKDERKTHESDAIGSPVERRFVLQGSGRAVLRLEEKRAWDESEPTLNTFQLDLSLVGKEPEGLPRSRRVLAA